MKQFLLSTFFLITVASTAMEQPLSIFELRPFKRKLSATEVIDLQNRCKLSNTTANKSLTPILDTHKYAYIVGILKPAGIEKLRRKIPHQIGALLAQKKHIGKLLTQEEEALLYEWQTRIAEKYTQKANS